ncbi:kinase-like protein [Sistotremastrum suecicum HHB10207 ss-3]|uniref:Kinase-like protein n=1 Tax=Sistotremastrum suecicum HHB10207 ss-3 TaxID=1314776 RepID=A0A166FE93_9AGAM|nr:kinase-like protein [Sistotremastrum suecicum HHB10207 ss-3]
MRPDLRSMSLSHEEESDFKSRRPQLGEAGIRMSTSPKTTVINPQNFIPDLTGNIEDISREPVVIAMNEVYTGKRKSTGEKVGLKATRLVSRAGSHGPPKASKELQREINNWVKLDHKYILPFLGTCVCNDKFFLVSPWADYGNAMDFLKSKPKANRLKIIRQVAEAVSYLHNLEPILTHGDLKPQNVLISRTRKVLLCDFGLGMLDNMTFTPTMQGGTAGFQAPEVLAGNARTTATDVWAFASMAFQIVVEKPPPPIEPADTPQPSEEIDLSRGMDEHLWSILVRCWSYSPSDRPNSREIVESIAALL